MRDSYEDSSDELAQRADDDYCDIEHLRANTTNLTADSYEVIGDGKPRHPVCVDATYLVGAISLLGPN